MPTAGSTISDARRDADEAARVLTAGGLVVLPTETVYGIAALATSDDGYAALAAFKGGAKPRPFAVHVADPDDINRYADLSEPTLSRLVRRLMPGPVTLIVDVARETIDDRLAAAGLPDDARTRLYHDGRIGLRCPDHDLARAAIRGVDGPVLCTSIAPTGTSAAHDADTAIEYAGDAATFTLDGGRCRYRKPSTLIRVTGSGAKARFEVTREGVIDARMVHNMMERTLLFVCTGNTCRSPMAAGIARSMLAEREGVPVEDLAARGWRVESAGVAAMPGGNAADDAVAVMRDSGIDISSHRSKAVSLELVHDADAVYCMTQRHRDALIRAFPQAAEKTHLLDADKDIADPIGAGRDAYVRCAAQIREQIEHRLKEQQA